jgi:hypothetical protein
MVSGTKWILVGMTVLALGLATEAGAQTVAPASAQQVEVVGAAASTAPVVKGKKGKHHKKKAKHAKKKANKQSKGKHKGKKAKA